MNDNIIVNFEHPANASILSYLGSPERLERSVSKARQYPSCSPGSVLNPYTSLGTHPDLVMRLWDEITTKLPMSCRWIVYGTPVLVNPISGIIFAFAEGTHTYAFRLPAQERQKAIKAGAKRVHPYPAIPSLNIEASTLNLDIIGEEWVFGQWLKGEEKWCLAAYNFVMESKNDNNSTVA